MKILSLLHSDYMQICKTSTLQKKSNTCKRDKIYGLNVLKIHSVALKCELRFLNEGGIMHCPNFICHGCLFQMAAFFVGAMSITCWWGREVWKRCSLRLSHTLESNTQPSCVPDGGIQTWKGTVLAPLNPQCNHAHRHMSRWYVLGDAAL